MVAVSVTYIFVIYFDKQWGIKQKRKQRRSNINELNIW